MRRRSASFAAGKAAAASRERQPFAEYQQGAAPRITTKKKTSLRTMGPTNAISRLLEGIHWASLNSCRPVMPSCTATMTRITLVTAKKRANGNLKRALKEENTDGNRHRKSRRRCRSTPPSLRSKARRRAGSAPAPRLRAAPSETRTCRGRIRPRDRILPQGIHAPLDMLAQVARHAVHPHDHGDHENGGHQQQHALETVLADLPSSSATAAARLRATANPTPAQTNRERWERPVRSRYTKTMPTTRAASTTFAKSDEKRRDQARRSQLQSSCNSIS